MHEFKNFPFATIVGKKDIAAGHFLIWLKPQPKFLFKPGQYVTLGIEEIERPYSIVSAPHEENIELFLEMVPKELETEESLTPKLYALKEGDRVMLRPTAKGRFLLEENAQTHVMISTVTGIAPFISMLRSYLHGDYKKKFEKPLYVFQGSSHVDEFGYYDELMTMAKAGHIVYEPSISRPADPRNSEWKGLIGRINLIAEELFKKNNIQPNDTTMIYLCGNKGMIEDLGNKREKPGKPIGKLIQAGFKTKEEIFF